MLTQSWYYVSASSPNFWRIYARALPIAAASFLYSTAYAQPVLQDRTGHGAVLCSWNIYLEVRDTLDVCFPEKYPDLHRELDSAIDKINHFIADNAVPSTTIEALEADIAARATAVKIQSSRLDPNRRAEACVRSDLSQMVVVLSRQTADVWQKSIADLLSVPRLSVMNPCL